MSVKSIFEFEFAPEASADGLTAATAIGNDMPAEAGYEDHEIIQDVADPGHLQIVTRWQDREHADAVLARYVNHANVARAVQLHGGPPRGFVGDVRA